jgi:ribosomal protein S6--L-glutamate ligase
LAANRPARLAIVAGGPGWHVQDLLRAAGELDVDARWLDFRTLSAAVGMAGAGETTGALRPGQDVVLVRGMPAGSLEQVIFRMDVLGRLEAAGVRVVNRPRSLEAAIDKYLSTALLEAAGLPVPPTIVCQSAAQASEALAALGGDAVLKPLFGSEGKGLERLRSGEAADARCRDLESRGTVLYLQRFVDHPGHDFRLFVLGERVLCGMQRTARDGWITNVARGGRAGPLDVTPELEALALRSARAVGTDVCGVDVLPDRDGKLWVLEVNAVPGWRALAAVSGVDVAREVVRFVLAHPPAS